MSSGASTAGYAALHESAAWLDVSSRGRIAVVGPDRLRLLHAIASNAVEGLSAGQGTYAFFLNAQGRIQADSHIFVSEDRVLIDCEPEAGGALLKHIESYIIMDDVRLEDAGESTAIALEGPRSEEVAQRALGDVLPENTPFAHRESRGIRVVRCTLSGQPAVWFFDASEGKNQLLEKLESAGASAALAEDFRVTRVENRRPRFGEDYTSANIPHETGLLQAVSFSKGCYLGQEIVERVRARGQVQKLLVSLEFNTRQALEPATAVRFAGEEAGRLSSPVFSPRRGKVMAFAILRREAAAAGTEVEANGIPGRVLPLS
jgi:aminomethyltransferase